MTSLFRVNKTMVKTTIRRYLPISAFGFLFLFMTIIFPGLVYDESAYTLKTEGIKQIVFNNSIGTVGYLMIFPILTVVLVYSYLHKEASVTAIHSEPYDRVRVFNSYFISGVVLLVIPIVIIGIIIGFLLPIELAFFWSIETLIAAIFAYIVGVLAGVVTGNVLMHAFVSCFLNVFLSAIVAFSMIYGQTFLHGFSLSKDIYQYSSIFSPVSEILFREFNYSFTSDHIKLLGIYIAVGIVLLAITKILYQKIKLERIGESITFKMVKPLFTVFITFMGMTAFGILFIDQTALPTYKFYLAMIIGGIFTFLLTKIIIDKTTKVISAKTLRDGVVTALVMILLVSAFAFDITGYEKSVPKVDEISSVDVSLVANYFNDDIGRFDLRNFYGSYKGLSSKDVIDNYLGFHKSMINIGQNSQDQIYKDKISYLLKNDKVKERAYMMEIGFDKNSSNLKNIYESKEFKEKYSISNIQKKFFANASVGGQFESYITFNEEDKKTLINALNRDFQKRTYEEQLSKSISHVVLGAEKNVLELGIKLSDKNTLAFLESKGLYLSKLLSENNKLSQIVLVEKNKVITDKKEIIKIIKNAFGTKYITDEYSHHIENEYNEIEVTYISKYEGKNEYTYLYEK
ncbi:MAG: hypothetical protein RSA49_02840 [Anaerovoracaceae bacterium]